MRRALPLLLAAAVVIGGGAFAVAQLDKTQGRIGPDSKTQPSGRVLDPAGRTTGRLGNLPVGGGITTNGRYLWTLSAGRGNNDIRIVAVDPPAKCRKGRRGARCRRARLRKVGRVVQTLPMPGVSGGMVMHRDNRTAYVSGVQESKHKDQKVPADVPGKEGDVIHVFRYDGQTGRATRDGVIEVPPPSGAPVPQDFPPKTSGTKSWPQDLALSRDGGTLLAALNLADHAAIIDTKTKAVRYVKTGTYPRGAAITHDGKRGLVSNEADGTVSVIDLASARVVKTLRVGPNLSHPQAIATDPKTDRAYVAVTHQDLIAVLNTDTLEVERTISVSLPAGLGTGPVGLSLTRDGRRLLVANSGEDAIAVIAIPQTGSDFTVAGGARTARLTARAESVLTVEGRRGLDQAESEEEEAAEKLGEEAEEKAEAALAKRPVRARPKDFSVIGRVPTGSYPVGAWATPGSKHLVWLSAKGLGVGPNPRGPSPLSKDDSDDAQGQYQYLPREVFGNAGILRFPSDARIEQYTPRAAKALRPSNATKAPPGSPIAGDGPSTKLKHVFYIVRENRTYDQVLGDDPRGDGDPKLTLFGPDVTPNAHALAKRFPLLDHVFANSEASIDGHFWTSAAAVSDYVTRAWHQNYGGRGRPYDFGVYSVTWPASGFLFDRAESQGINWFNFGEAVAGTVPLTDKNRGQAETDLVARKFAKSDLGQNGCFPNDASSGGVDVVAGAAGVEVEVYDSSLPPGARPGAQSRFECFRAKFNSWVAAGSVPAFVYATFANDHTAGTRPGFRTPKAMVAENDYALGQIVDLISKSPVWKESAILVIEDDSQNGADHVDAHRIPAFVISPYAKEGAVVHTRYDFLSFIRTLEVIIGMKPLNLFDNLAVPMYDAFTSEPSNDKPYDVIRPKQAIDERNPASAPNARLSEELEIGRTDQTPQRILDRIVWQSVHGARSEPPPPGPNASELDNEAARQLGLDPATGKRVGPAKEREEEEDE